MTEPSYDTTKSAAKKRPAPLSLRLTDDERNRLEQQAGGLALGA